jgi:hypothetical protein
MTTRFRRAALAALALACTSSLLPAAEPLYIPTPEERARVLLQERPAPEPPPWSLAETTLLAGQNDFDVTKYFLDLNFDEATRRIEGSVTITATSLVPSLQPGGARPRDPDDRHSVMRRDGAFVHASRVAAPRHARHPGRSGRPSSSR